MKTALLIFLIAIVLVVSIFAVMFLKRVLLLNAAKKGRPLKFKNAVELMRFIREYFECEKQSYVALYGFVEHSIYDDAVVRMGISDDAHLSVDVFLIAPKGHEKVTAICADTDANLKKGDFVAVLPIFDETHNIWSYTLVTKLKPLFLGGDNGFLIEEKYC